MRMAASNTRDEELPELVRLELHLGERVVAVLCEGSARDAIDKLLEDDALPKQASYRVGRSSS
jgi:hypothetical protein